MSTYELTVIVLTKWLRSIHDNGSTEQLKTDLRDATSDANTTESQAATIKESHRQ